MRGRVRAFVPEKGYGFIDGEDGQSYFVHRDDVDGRAPLLLGQEVVFDPRATPKGLRARQVAPGPAPQPILVDPGQFIMTRSPTVPGCVIVRVVAENCWGESNDPNEAREVLKGVALRAGANAVVGLTLDKYTEQRSCSNYRFTMHRFYGHAVIVRRTEYTTDPGRIARSQADLRDVQAGPLQMSSGTSALVRPPAWRFIPVLAWSLLRTAGTIAVVSARVGVRRASRHADRAFSPGPRGLSETDGGSGRAWPLGNC